MLKKTLSVALITPVFLMTSVSAVTPAKVPTKIVKTKLNTTLKETPNKRLSKNNALTFKHLSLKNQKSNLGNNTGNIGISAKISTLGLGLDLTYAITDKFNARFNINGGSLDARGNRDGIDYEGNVDLQSIGGILDYHPTGGEFRLSVGLYNNKNKIDVDASGVNNNNVEIGGRRYDLSHAKLNTKVGFKSTAPYIGLGWGNAADSESKFSITTDIGILFQGKPDAKLSTTGTVIDNQTGKSADVSILNTQLALEEKHLNDSNLKDFKLLPVISLGVNYRF